MNLHHTWPFWLMGISVAALVGLQVFSWQNIALICSHPAVSRYLIERAQRTPYWHLPDYMDRFWLVPYRERVLRTVHPPPDDIGRTDPYDSADGTGPVSWRRPLAWLIQRAGYAVRVHHIKRADNAPDRHNHPWNARTIILRGGYVEDRENGVFARAEGDTATIGFGEFHNITWVTEGGVWTLFITRKYLGSWGFKLPDGTVVPHKEYQRPTP